MKNNNISILNSTGRFSREVRDSIALVAQQSLALIGEHFDLSDVDITFSPFYSDPAPSGIGGYALSPFRLEILIDCNREDIVEAINKELRSVLAHEVHHCMRMAVVGSENSLADNIITEGLACYFERNFNGGVVSSLFNDMSELNWQDIYRKMKPEINSESFNFNLYFLGADVAQYAKYAGYWVGYNLVKRLAEERGLDDSELMKLPVEDFLL
ncbi:DUF2268 domain-containing putative Zn-dependent protease [Pelagibaculum spongiae]|uniref:DUF2268 domain-containing protein n=1 Tax=Pelagibaculum spongiae TaxID=2080658 RepID=A0A2V1GWP2_9GAMM|nr:DUF2268 domain-containing putative Zn-dependent protease [Pelagibaculum spongiae]PVZ71601.1 hypothetical protein DC094_00745 [Pelagibaculum spongiae]